MQSSKDAIYSQPQQVSDFRFDDTVAEVFPDMIQRSVPGYNTIVDAIGQLAGRYATNNSNIYDLGCSLGAVSLAAAKYVVADNCSIIGYSELEISQKRESIENILRAETFEAHQTRLRNAGFDDVVLWFQCFNFASIVAIKN